MADRATIPFSKQSILFLGMWFVSSVLLWFGLTRPVIQISVNVVGVIQEALDRQPVVGLLLQEKGLQIGDIAGKLPASSITQQSVVSSAVKLYELQNYVPALLIILFSIVSPILKQAALLIIVLGQHRSQGKLGAFTQYVHKWAMLDVFVLAMVVLALSSAASWEAILLDGFYWFLGYFFLAGALGIFAVKKSLSPVNHVPTTPQP